MWNTYSTTAVAIAVTSAMSAKFESAAKSKSKSHTKNHVIDTPTAKAASSPFGMSGILKCLCERSPFLFCSNLQMRVCHHPS